MLDFWKKKPALGVGLGVGLLGAVALALRYGLQRVARQPLPDNISPAIFATRVCQTTHGEIIYHTSGAGELLVFLHGIYPGASSYEWSRVYPQFAVGHEVVAPDLIGFGESERPRRGLDADDQVRALADLLFTIGQGRSAAIVASGFGASLAVKLAVQHPDLVRRLILYAPLGLDAAMRRMPLGLSTLSRLPAMNSFVYRNYFARRPFIRGWLARFGFGDPSLITDEIVDVLTSFAGQYGAEHALRAFLRGRLLYDVKSQLGRLLQPVCVLWPDLPDRFPPTQAERLSRFIPNCHNVLAGRTGALGGLEAPEMLHRLIDEELARPIQLPGAA
ncbi:MAG TPA: alpha/beta hydrolase [Chthoniobacterales bacterium]|nr:alpha/beta hydrolase [Chthoniobacterales bacterium]